MSGNKTTDGVLIDLTVPAALVSKTSGVHWQKASDTYVRQALDEVFRVTLGRCKWNNDIRITGTLEQFAIFVCALKKKGHAGLLDKMTYEMFKPLPADKQHIFVAVESRPKRLHAETRAMPVAAPSESC